MEADTMAVEAVARKREPDKQAAPEAESKDIVVELTVPVQAHGEEIKKLVFRRPTGGDLMALGEGWPININYQTGQITPNPAAMGAMMSALAGVPPSTIRNISSDDWATCAWKLMGFFTPGA
jgi:Phage tail assembly chaperone proteins, E, or 41 or 14